MILIVCLLSASTSTNSCGVGASQNLNSKSSGPATDNRRVYYTFRSSLNVDHGGWCEDCNAELCTSAKIMYRKYGWAFVRSGLPMDLSLIKLTICATVSILSLRPSNTLVRQRDKSIENYGTRNSHAVNLVLLYLRRPKWFSVSIFLFVARNCQ